MEKQKNTEKKALDYMRANGVKALAVKAARKLAERTNRPVDYSDWLPKHLPTEGELSRQRKATFDYAPKISIVVPLYKTKEEYLKQLVDSVKAQTYTNWELCLSDGSGKHSPNFCSFREAGDI